MDQSEFFNKGFCQKLEARIYCLVFFLSCGKSLPVLIKKTVHLGSGLLLFLWTLEAESGVFTSCSGTLCSFFPVQPLMVKSWQDGNSQRLDFTCFLPSGSTFLNLSLSLLLIDWYNAVKHSYKLAAVTRVFSEC